MKKVTQVLKCETNTETNVVAIEVIARHRSMTVLSLISDGHWPVITQGNIGGNPVEQDPHNPSHLLKTC